MPYVNGSPQSKNSIVSLGDTWKQLLIEVKIIISKKLAMKSFYKIISIATAVLFVYLFSLLFFFSDSFIEDLGLEPTTATIVLARRASMFMLGIAILMFCSRNFPVSKARQINCLSVGATLLGLACMSTFEFVNGNVNSSIMVAIIIESVLSVSYGIILIVDRKTQG